MKNSTDRIPRLLLVLAIAAVGFYFIGGYIFLAFVVLAVPALMCAYLGPIFAVGIVVWQVYSFLVDGRWPALSAMRALNNGVTRAGPDFYRLLADLPGLIKILEWLPASIFFALLAVLGWLCLFFNDSILKPLYRDAFSSITSSDQASAANAGAGEVKPRRKSRKKT